MKKQLALSMSAAMALTLLAGCGGSGSSSSAAASGSDTAEAAATGAPTITFMMPTFYGTEFQNENSDQVIQAYTDYTGINVEWRLEANDTYKDKFGLTLMDKDNMPMVLTASGALDANIVDAAKAGAFWDLSHGLPQPVPGKQGRPEGPDRQQPGHRPAAHPFDRPVRPGLPHRLGGGCRHHRAAGDD